jgi:hypothetical protein
MVLETELSGLKILILALASTKEPYLADLLVQEETLGSISNTNVQIYWILGGTHEIKLDKQRLYLPVEEKFPNILEKTIMAIRQLNKDLNPDIVIRTNTSSYFNLEKVHRLCEKLNSRKFDFAGYLETYKQPTDPDRPIRFVNGSGIFLSKNATHVLEQMDFREYLGTPDDVAITLHLEKFGMTPISLKRNNICYHHLFFPRAHIRVKSWNNRSLTHHRMMLVHKFATSRNMYSKLQTALEIYRLEVKSVDLSAKKVFNFAVNLFLRRFKA